MGNERRARLPAAVCSDWPVPVTLQLAGQIKWAIAAGEAPPGTVLPPVERLAATVGLNRNTVNAVYTELARQGLLELRRGTGTRVTDGSQVAGWQRRIALLELISSCLDEAASHGFSAQEAAFLMLARAAWIEQQQRQRPRIGLLAAPGCDAEGFAATLAAVTDCAVETVLAEDLEADGAVGRAAAAIVAGWHVAVVREGAFALLPGPPGRPHVPGLPEHVVVVPLAWMPSLTLVQALSKLPPGAPVATVAATEPQARLMRDGIVGAGFGQLRVFSGSLADGPLTAALPHMVQVWADSTAAAVLREQHPGLIVREYEWTVTAGGQERLQQACEQVGISRKLATLSPAEAST